MTEKLYRYDHNHVLREHEVEKKCKPEILIKDEFGVLYQCLHGTCGHNPFYHFGYLNLHEAKREAIFNARKRIIAEQDFIVRLKK